MQMTLHGGGYRFGAQPGSVGYRLMVTIVPPGTPWEDWAGAGSVRLVLCG